MRWLPSFSFRFKILLLVVVILSGTIGVTLMVTQHRVQDTYQELFARQYQSQIGFFTEMQKLRMGRVTERCQQLASNTNFIEAVETENFRDMYRVAREELQNLLPAGRPTGVGMPEGTGRPGGDRRGGRPPDFQDPGPRPSSPDPQNSTYFKIYNKHGTELLEAGRALQARALPTEALDQYRDMVVESKTQQIGYFRAVGDAPGDILVEVVITSVYDDDAEGELVGAIVMGFQVTDFGERFMQRVSHIQSGIILGSDLFSSTIPVTQRKRLFDSILKGSNNLDDSSSAFNVEVDDEPYRCFVRQLNPGSVFPIAYHVSLYSLEEEEQDLRELRLQLLGFGGIVFVGGGILAWLLSHGLSVPLRELLAGTREIELGNYRYQVPVRSNDEIGELASSFNRMAEGLEQREKYKNVLDQVADREVASALIKGEVALGGVLLPVTVLFCDIRGFSALSQKLPPQEVVRLLNDHMTAMTRVVYEHHGVVDKFVGDLIMAVFGAPKSYGNDAENAARCALKMIQTRHDMNESGDAKIHVGIGLASGEVVAGCMGSHDRLNYTVLGEKVNLGSRLCDIAGRMDILLDVATFEALAGKAEFEDLQDTRLKGFKDPVRIHRLVRIRSVRAPGEQ